jgi:hypothetical protein
MCFLRHLSEEEAIATLEEALPYRDKFIGVGLDSSELGTRRKNSRACSSAAASSACTWSRMPARRAAGVYRNRAGPAQRRAHRPRRALPGRPALVERLAQEQMALTVCPLSNIKLRVFDHMGSTICCAARRRPGPPSTRTTRPTSAAT